MPKPTQVTREKDGMPGISELTADLDHYLRERYGYKKETCSHNYQTVFTRTEKADLYLRFKPETHFHPNSLVIARLAFQRQRVGEGTAFLRFLTEIAPKHGIEHIAIEQVITDPGTAFAIKFGFKKIFNDFQRTIPVHELKLRLNAGITNPKSAIAHRHSPAPKRSHNWSQHSDKTPDPSKFHPIPSPARSCGGGVQTLGTTVILNGIEYHFQFASDTQRDGVGLKCFTTDKKTTHAVLEIFKHNGKRQFTFRQWGSDLPLELVEFAISVAKKDLGSL